MVKKRNRKKELHKKIAKNRINYLFLLAEKYALNGRLKLSDRYVYLARKISMRYLVPIPKQFKRRFCKHCYSYLLPSVSSRTRIKNGKIVTYCNKCKNYTRIIIHTKIGK